MNVTVTLKEERKNVNYKSCFDIIGPIMIGPSSSHTAGALAIGNVAYKLFQGLPKKVVVRYYESFAETHKGHGTDYAIISGVLGFAPDDPRVPNAIEIAKSKGIDITFIEEKDNSPVGHPNTADIYLEDENHHIRTIGISVGGGIIEVKHIEIDGFVFDLQGTLPICLVITKRNDFKPIMLKFFKKHNVKVNVAKHFEANGKYLYEFDLNSQLPTAVKEELPHIDDQANIILL